MAQAGSQCFCLPQSQRHFTAVSFPQRRVRNPSACPTFLFSSEFLGVLPLFSLRGQWPSLTLLWTMVPSGSTLSSQYHRYISCYRQTQIFWCKSIAHNQCPCFPNAISFRSMKEKRKKKKLGNFWQSLQVSNDRRDQSGWKLFSPSSILSLCKHIPTRSG